MTELSKRYLAMRDDGLPHRAAVRALAHQISVDYGTVARLLRRSGVLTGLTLD